MDKIICQKKIKETTELKVNKNKIKKKEIRLQVHGENKKKNRSIAK